MISVQSTLEDIHSHSVSFRNETEGNCEEISLSTSNSESDSPEESVEDRRICQYNTPVVRSVIFIIINPSNAHLSSE